ncbi:hypothetical protein N657DRAFT_641715 [Parathielavia appendiculata]|uniref:Wings apart-like protein C-terminal domain-containing protein n=1 Tax=Parathielavia appendiculata TaxID=2587402 RepID=A0AAN6Z7Q9_9PEZI|nr:hypothetical protein N657DRAFT_641715 [Parathielavia appendiculata]
MMATNAGSVYDFGFAPAPTKKITTYGKGGRRRTDVTRPATLRHAESAPAIPSSSTKSQSTSPEPPRLTTRALSSAKVKQQDIREYGSASRQKPVEGAHSQPLPDVYDFDSQPDELPRPTKRRRAPKSLDKGRPSGRYSTPDTSPIRGGSPVLLSEEEIPSSAPDAIPPAASKQSTLEEDIEMRDDVPSSMPFSAKTSRTLRNLSVGSKNLGAKRQQIPIRLSKQASSDPATREPPTPPAAATGPHPQPVRKRRLIDTLAAQAEGMGSSSEDEVSSQRSDDYNSQSPPALQNSPLPPPSALQPKSITRPVMTVQKAGPKFTYSQQRTMLADDDPILEGGGLGDLDGPAGGALFNFGRLTKSATVNTFSYLDEDDETANAGAVRSIHELRQAGANSRFADEIDDILDRVGSPSATPSSLRRGALLELAQKMKQKDFRLQFRNHSDGENLLRSLADESDVISGYAILAIITTLLAATTSAHLIRQLRSQGLAVLISRLLDVTADMVQLARDRKQNVSRNGQLTIASIKSSLLELPIWEPVSPTSMSPRALALKCLDLLMRQPTQAPVEDVLPRAVTDRLFSIVASGVSNSACWDFPNQQESCDFYLALYILEGHSISAMQSELCSMWTEQYAPVVADVLETALERSADQFGDLESLALRISLNITNHNGQASQLCVEKGLLRRLTKSACNAFGMVLTSMKGDSLWSKLLESLIMMLGAMINFCAYYPPASGSLAERGDGTDPALNELFRVFADNHAKTSDADSMEKTQLNVALGYLSIFLGYLCLSDTIRDKFVLVHPKKTMRPLLDSINEFIAFHHKVAEAQSGEGARQRSDSGSLARLQELADQLAVLR